MPEAAAAGALLRLRGITKRFAGAPALEGVDLTIAAGRVHALVGENGAGKSTLVKIMTGAHRPDAGTIVLDGAVVDFRSPRAAQALGVVAVYQEINLLAYSTVAETLFLGREPTRFGLPFGLVDHRRMRDDAGGLLRTMGLDIDVAARVGDLPIASRQMLAIARGVSLGAKVLILDEPTSSLGAAEVTLLFALVRKVTAGGAGVVYVSHRLDELYAVCDDVTVLRDGRLITTRALAGLDRLDLVCAMLGRRRDELAGGATALKPPAGEGSATPSPRRAGAPLMALTAARSAPVLQAVSLTLAPGEIVGLAGLLGSGRTETAHVLFGVRALDGGELRVDGVVARISAPRDAIRRRMALLPEDRKRDGIVPGLSVAENLTLAALPLLSRMGIVSPARQAEIVQTLISRLRIKAASARQPVAQLSGGNQQKVLLGRCLCLNPRLLLLDEPTRGIDVGAKAEIQSFIAGLAEDGVAVLMISSELEELVEGSSRVVVLRDGRSVATLERADISEAAIISAVAAADDRPAPAPAGRR